MNVTLYLGWRDCGPKREGRTWRLTATRDRQTLDKPPWSVIVRGV